MPFHHMITLYTYNYWTMLCPSSVFLFPKFYELYLPHTVSKLEQASTNSIKTFPILVLPAIILLIVSSALPFYFPVENKTFAISISSYFWLLELNSHSY